MALPLPTLTFYRMPDSYLTGSTIADMLIAIRSSLTSSVDYKGTTLPSTHLWTWATGSTSGSISAIYNISIPSGSGMTQNPTIIVAGFSGSATPTMTIDTYASSTILIGVSKNGTTYNDWTATLPMTTGSFTGYERLAVPAANATTTYVRTYISQEMIFMSIVQNTASQYFAFAGAAIEPFTSYTDSLTGVLRSAETDDRIYGMNSSITAYNSADFNSNGGSLYGRGAAFLPTTSSVVGFSKYNFPLFNLATYGMDAMDNRIYEKLKLTSDSAAANSSLLGTLRGMYLTSGNEYYTLMERNGNTDLYHIYTANNFPNQAAGGSLRFDSHVFVIKAAQ